MTAREPRIRPRHRAGPLDRVAGGRSMSPASRTVAEHIARTSPARGSGAAPHDSSSTDAVGAARPSPAARKASETIRSRPGAGVIRRPSATSASSTGQVETTGRLVRPNRDDFATSADTSKSPMTNLRPRWQLPPRRSRDREPELLCETSPFRRTSAPSPPEKPAPTLGQNQFGSCRGVASALPPSPKSRPDISP